MPSTEVQRTLVKSPPELWAELSDPAALARHLSELGEIHLTRVEPESAVEWEAENVRGSVQLKASGWGTKVTFSVTRALPEQAAADHEPVAVEPEPVAIEPKPQLAELALGEPNPAPEPQRAPRRSFFARLFRRRRRETPMETPEPAAVLPEAEELEPAVEAPPEPQIETTEEPADLAAELAAMEQAMVEQDTALLTAILDRLGAAHHRPFSRG